MKKLTFLFLGLALFVAQPVAAQFVPVDAPRAPVNGDHLYFIDEYADPGPYWGRLSSDPTQPQFSIYCVDANHYVQYGGDDFYINATSLGGGDATMGQTRLGANAGAADLYRMTAFLAGKYALNAGNFATIQNAIWSVTSGITATTAAALLVTEARGAVETMGAFAFRDWYVMTDVNAYDSDQNGTLDAGGKQEYITHVTPEPATVILLLSGLVFVGFAARRRVGELA